MSSLVEACAYELILLDPYWLVRQKRFEEAKSVFKRIASEGYYDERSLEAYIAYIKHTDELEKAEAAQGSFKEMFKGTNLRRTEAMLVSHHCMIGKRFRFTKSAVCLGDPTMDWSDYDFLRDPILHQCRYDHFDRVQHEYRGHINELGWMYYRVLHLGLFQPTNFIVYGSDIPGNLSAYDWDPWQCASE